MKRLSLVLVALRGFSLLFPLPLHAGTRPVVELFSPTGDTRGVRQAAARFSEPMAAFGDPRLDDPFTVSCAAPGKGRWADSRNWLYDFDEDLPAGLTCTFTLKPSAATLGGTPVGGDHAFSFSTGGPAVLRVVPRAEDSKIDEDQAFVLDLDAEPDETSLLARVSFSVSGVAEGVGVTLVKGKDRKTLLEGAPGRFLATLRRDTDGDAPAPARARPAPADDPRVVVLKARQRFPSDAEVRLVWGAGVRTATGLAVRQPQVFPFRTRGPFTAEFRCGREKSDAPCLPVLPLELSFSSPISRELASQVVVTGGADGKVFVPDVPNGGEASDPFVRGLRFSSPLPANTPFVLTLPKALADDAGRPLANRSRFPLRFSTGAFPPLAKFSAPFGIIERSPEPLLPVTLRNLEPQVAARVLAFPPREGGGAPVATFTGRVLEVSPQRADRLIRWLHRVEEVHEDWNQRGLSLLAKIPESRAFPVPKPGGAKAFEVVGIPLNKPGFYVVELESKVLGSSLLGAQKPMYVPAAALVTDLSVHFKWGRENSLVWVTSLSSGKPVAGARVAVHNPDGKVAARGTTGPDGLVRLRRALPEPSTLRHSRYDQHGGYFVTARTGEDLAFVFSSWDRGIEPYRFPVATGGWNYDPSLAHTVFDRTLLRAGETVSMKHFFRRHTLDGLSWADKGALPRAVAFEHVGSDQRYEFPLAWSGGAAETAWTIPRDAKLGPYRVTLLERPTALPKGAQPSHVEGAPAQPGQPPKQWPSGTFRVEEFRVPLLKAVVQGVGGPLIRAREADVDLQLSYLAGGGAGGAPVTLRTSVRPRTVTFPDYEDFVFSNGGVREGVRRGGDDEDEGGGGEGDEAQEEEPQDAGSAPKPKETALVLDPFGALRTRVTELQPSAVPQTLAAELDFKDPSGETQTASSRLALWPARVLVGLRPESWSASREVVRFQVQTTDLSGRPQPAARVDVDLFERKRFSHRKRLLGGFYGYEHVTETRRVGTVCSGQTDAGGRLVCEVLSSVSGNVVLVARAADAEGNETLANRSLWVAGKDDWWFDASDGDRIDVLPEKPRYEPGERAKLQVRMPFREATALVTVEREGVLDAFVTPLSGKQPVVEVPVTGVHAPNVYVSVLCVRGRVADVAPTAMVDLGKPSFKLGLAELQVGWKAHELKVSVSPSQPSYKIRQKARVRVSVRTPSGAPLPPGAEAAVAAVDEGLLELAPNESWDALRGLMGRRPHEVLTSTAQLQVVGKRHFGLKAQRQGGGGGRQTTRELFDTLLFWKARVPLDAKGEGEVDIPLNDSLTSFRIVAVANAGPDLFGTGEASLRTTQDLMLLSGLPPLVREGDRYRAAVTVRNGSQRPLEAVVSARVQGLSPLESQRETLAPGEAKELGWDVTAPPHTAALTWDVEAVDEKQPDTADRLRVTQKLVPAVPVRTVQAALSPVGPLAVALERPAGALAGRGGVEVTLRPRLADGLEGIRRFMGDYPYSCLEQRASRAVALRDRALWQGVTADLPSFLDGDGLARYYPSGTLDGSDALTAYLLSLSHEAGWPLPPDALGRMTRGLGAFVEGRLRRETGVTAADLGLRKLAALGALARHGSALPSQVESMRVEPELWPTSALLDWIDLLLRMKTLPRRDERLHTAENLLRARLNVQGTTLTFSTEKTDALWWLMASGDTNAVRAVLALQPLPAWAPDLPRLMNGALGRQRAGAWDTTVANAWGVLALEKFSARFEKTPVAGKSSAALAGAPKTLDWARSREGATLAFPWPEGRHTLAVAHEGSGRPWASVRALAAVPLRAPWGTGYKLRKTLTPVKQQQPGKWSRGDVVRVTLDLEAQADRTWVAVTDPIPGGAAVLGSGFGGSKLLTAGEKLASGPRPAFTERSFEGFRATYDFVPKGRWTVEYTVRLNTEGTFQLPPTRVEAMYSPELFGESPNPAWEVGL